ncbi:MAG: NUDIX hydrolase [Opitutaceae bacterium]|jgi:ADP-ribose pyrophosphatase|nr:NUDIX hydrolase [Opitutaceae bacterium]
MITPPSPETPELLHATRWLSLYQRGKWIYASRRDADAPPRIDGLAIVAFHEEAGVGGTVRRRLVVIEEWRVPVQTWTFGMPAGLLEPGETLATCAERELAEETGLKLTWTGATSGTTFSSPGMTDESIAFIVAGCSGTPAENPGVDGERIRVHLLDRAGCRALLARHAAGGAALSMRFWPVLLGIAETGGFGGRSVD